MPGSLLTFLLVAPVRYIIGATVLELERLQKLRKLCESFEGEWRTSYAEYAKEIINEGDLDHDLQEMLEFVAEWGDDLRRLLHVAPHADKQTI